MCEHKSPRKGTDLSDKTAHQKDHQSWSRRNFLKTLGLAGGLNFALHSLPVTSMFASPLTAALSGNTGKKLVLIRLKGGNDGLNTFIPLYQFDEYSALRPTIGYQPANLINLSDDFAMPNAMQSLTSLWNQGKMRVVNSVGYPDHNLSHFTGADIMASGNSDVNSNSDGWLARYFVHQNPDYIENPCPFPPAIKIGGPTSLVFNDPNQVDLSANFANAQQLNDLVQMGTLFDNTNAPDDCYYGDQVLYLRTIANSAFLYSSAIFDAYNNSTTDAAYPLGLGEQLELVARLIKGGLETQFYLVTLDGFDTHVSQNGSANHAGLLQNLSEAVQAFYEDLSVGGHDQEVLSMSYSEFGRRVEQNGFSGTDHGTALPVMFFGPALEGAGFHGLNPDLNDLDGTGNLHFGTDFRSLYATILEEWLCLDPDTVDVILGDNYARLTDIGLTCESVSIPALPTPSAINHRLATLGGGQYQLIVELNRGEKLRIELLTISGKRIQLLTDQYFHQGEHRIHFSLAHLQVELVPLVYVIQKKGQRIPVKFIASSR